MNIRILLVSLLAAVPLICVEAQKKEVQSVLFTIDNSPVYLDEFVYLYKKNHQGREEEFTKEKIEEYLDLFVNFKLKVREAELRGLGDSEAFKNELNGYKAELKKPFVAEPDLLDSLTKEAYLRLGSEVNASHILIAVNQNAKPADTLAAFRKAEEIIGKLKDGADFRVLAMETSDDPSAKTNGGNLGYFTALQMVYPFEQAAFQLEVGEVSKPVRTRFGYHIIKVEDRRPSRGEVEVSHILVRGGEEEAKKSIYDAYDQLQKGAAWNEICKKYSQDPGTKDNGGRLRPFGSGALASAPQFEEIAFSLKEPGSLSAPFQTSFGWHIVRLEKKIPLPPFQELESSLQKRVARDDRLTISKTLAKERRKNLLKFFPAESLEDKLKLFADSSLLKGEGHSDKMGENNDVLFRLNNQSYGVRDFAAFVEKRQSPSAGTPNDLVKRFFDQYVDELLEQIEDEQLLRSNPEYRNIVNEYREGILLFSIMEKEIWNKASDDSLGQRKFYEANLSKFKSGDRVEARVLAASSEQARDRAFEKIIQGDSLTSDDLKDFKPINNFRSYEKGENAAVDKVNWTIGIHKTEGDGLYYLVEINSLVPPGYKKFEEVRAAVISDYQDFLEKKWIGELKNKYSVKVNAKTKKRAVTQLVGSK